MAAAGSDPIVWGLECADVGLNLLGPCGDKDPNVAFHCVSSGVGFQPDCSESAKDASIASCWSGCPIMANNCTVGELGEPVTSADTGGVSGCCPGAYILPIGMYISCSIEVDLWNSPGDGLGPTAAELRGRLAESWDIRVLSYGNVALSTNGRDRSAEKASRRVSTCRLSSGIGHAFITCSIIRMWRVKYSQDSACRSESGDVIDT